MSQFTKAADDIKSVANKLRGFLEIADALEKIGNIEHAAKSAEAVKEKANAEALAAKAQAAEAAKKLDAVLVDVNVAKEMAAEIEQNAKAKSAELLDEAKAKVLQVEADIENQKLQAKHAQVSAVKELSDLNEQIISKKNELSDIKSQIALIKQKIQNVVGA
jgi:chromosome segregation ATPase